MDAEAKRKSSIALFISAVILILALVIGWHLLLPFLDLSIVLGAGALGFIVASIVLLSIAIILFLMSAGIIAWILALLVSLWAVFTIVLIPIAFPLLIPLLIILFFIGFFTRRRRAS